MNNREKEYRNVYEYICSGDKVEFFLKDSSSSDTNTRNHREKNLSKAKK